MKKILFFVIMTIVSVNSFSGIFGGSGSSSDYWQMKTFFESVSINAQTLKTANEQLKQVNHMIEQARKMPDDFFKNHMKQYSEIVSTLSRISGNTKSVLRDAKKAELWFKDVYTDVNNKNYQNLIDRFTNSIDRLSYDAMNTAGLASEASKKTASNARTLLAKGRNASNPVQLLDVLAGWSSNLSSQLSVITEVLASDSRLKALEEAEKAQERKIAQERHKYTQNSLQNTIKKMETINNRQKKKK